MIGTTIDGNPPTAPAARRASTRRWVISGALVACGLLAVVGIAVARHATSSTTKPSPFAAALGLTSHGPATPHKSQASIARKVALDLLDEFTPPTDATPARTNGLGPVAVPGTPDKVIRSKSWNVPGLAGDHANRFANNLPPGFTKAGFSGVGSSGGVSTVSVTVEPDPTNSNPQLAHLPEGITAQLQVAWTETSDGNSRLTASAVVTWIRLRTRTEKISVDVDRLDVTHTAGMNDGSVVTRSTITDGATIARVAALLDALPPAPAGGRSCPMDDGEQFTLVFSNTTPSTTLATATVDAQGCRTVTITIPGHGRHTYDTINSQAGQALFDLLPTLMH